MRPDTWPGSAVTATPEMRSLLPLGLSGESSMLTWQALAGVGWIISTNTTVWS
jgi:hypothetical protein